MFVCYFGSALDFSVPYHFNRQATTLKATDYSQKKKVKAAAALKGSAFS